MAVNSNGPSHWSSSVSISVVHVQYLIKVGRLVRTAADRPEVYPSTAMPGLKKAYGALAGRIASEASALLTGFGDLLLIAFAAAVPEDCQFLRVCFTYY